MTSLTRAITTLGIISSSAVAGHLEIFSRPGLFNDRTGATVAVMPHPLWQPNLASAVWIAHVPTGVGDSDFQPSTGSLPALTVWDFFNAPAGSLTLKVWADNTAEVLLDGLTLFAPNFTENICANGPIGCEPEEFGLIETPYATGFHTLEFRVWQAEGAQNNVLNPFGLLYSGVATWDDQPVHTPEPGTFALIGAGLVAAGAWRRERV